MQFHNNAQEKERSKFLDLMLKSLTQRLKIKNSLCCHTVSYEPANKYQLYLQLFLAHFGTVRVIFINRDLNAYRIRWITRYKRKLEMSWKTKGRCRINSWPSRTRQQSVCVWVVKYMWNVWWSTQWRCKMGKAFAKKNKNPWTQESIKYFLQGAKNQEAGSQSS